MSEGTAAAEFAGQLRALKERSGLSYGVLAKRLHMSTSTLHRYCNGDAVPAEYAPVERLARLCRANPEELVELHRRWVLADAARGRKGAPGAAAEHAAAAAPVGDEPAGGGPGAEGAEAVSPQAEVSQAGVPEAEVSQAGVPQDEVPQDEVSQAEVPQVEVPEVTGTGTGTGEARPRRRRRTRTAVLAGIAVAVVLGGVTLALSLPGGGEADGDGRQGPVGAAGVGGGAGRDDSAASPSPSASPSASAEEKDKGTPSASASASDARPIASAGAAGRDNTVPLTVRADPYVWQDPCSQRYLIDEPPTEVSPPPIEQDAPAWVARQGAVSSGEQYVRVTVQGTGSETVVVDGLTVRVAGKRSPLPWNDFAMGYPGVGCGGNVPTRSFTVALDAARPVVTPESGHRNFPFKVSESDPEVYFIKADASAYDVSWYLELKWSSGSRSGTLTVGDEGEPFRTSGNNGRPAYEFPLGGEEWVPEGTTKVE
ncbi:helix-turn-helix domain-containing protein [Streptomyces sp. 15-116A]|uniref:helix-turn-helix domain-containing protein n=1 Tax=Streptomyces sp. 15-116A TaxID=2259035 RepID=UPI0021B246E8|nr:helix-turn-helix transcriptional regulator [Streptomyces sp. 15-116A]MCT7353331.1 helix-turn-helix domain-containing protein [Streptomyces sp. 15-116A]